jgi:hypothetical protein
MLILCVVKLVTPDTHSRTHLHDYIYRHNVTNFTTNTINIPRSVYNLYFIFLYFMYLKILYI